MNQTAQTIDLQRFYNDALAVGDTVSNYDSAGKGSYVALVFGTSGGAGHPSAGNVVTYTLFESDDTTIANATAIPNSRIVAQTGIQSSNGSFVFTGPFTKETYYQVGVQLEKRYALIKATASNNMFASFAHYGITQSLDGPTKTNADGSFTNFTVIVPQTT